MFKRMICNVKTGGLLWYRKTWFRKPSLLPSTFRFSLEYMYFFRLEMQWASSFGSASSLWTRGGLSDGFCLNSLDILLWNLWKWTGLNSLRTKITFSSLANPPPPLLLYWCGDTQKGHLSCCSSLYDSPFLLRSGLHSGMCTSTRPTDASPSSPSLGNILGNYSGKSNKGLGGKEPEINLGCHQVYPWCISTPPQW